MRSNRNGGGGSDAKKNDLLIDGSENDRGDDDDEEVVLVKKKEATPRKQKSPNNVMAAEMITAPTDDQMVDEESNHSESLDQGDTSKFTKEHRNTTFQMLKGVCRPLQTFFLLLANICAWYYTNGMNGIAMQKVAQEIQLQPSFMTILVNTCFVTATQLLFGAALGRLMILAYDIFFGAKGQLHYSIPKQSADVILSALHCAGSIFTNLGFMYGSASLVQVIKLLEPFETLLLSKMLLEDEGKHFTRGIVSAMALTVGAAISLIKSRPEQPPVLSCLFALCSGLVCGAVFLQITFRCAHNSALICSRFSPFLFYFKDTLLAKCLATLPARQESATPIGKRHFQTRTRPHSIYTHEFPVRRLAGRRFTSAPAGGARRHALGCTQPCGTHLASTVQCL